MSKRKQIEWNPQEWQLDPMKLDTEFVQYWRGNSMLTAQMRLDVARYLVTERRAFVITGQAIGALNEQGQPAD